MIRLLLRFIGLWFVAGGAIFFVIDAAKSISASALITTPLGQSWFELSSGTLNLSQAIIQRYLHPAIWDPGVLNILLLPSFVVLLAIGLIFLVIGRKKRPRNGFSTLAT
jgi:hypothetical protein